MTEIPPGDQTPESDLGSIRSVHCTQPKDPGLKRRRDARALAIAIGVCALGAALVVPFGHSDASSGALPPSASDLAAEADAWANASIPDGQASESSAPGNGANVSPPDQPSDTDLANVTGALVSDTKKTSSSTNTAASNGGAGASGETDKVASASTGDVNDDQNGCVLTARAIRRGNAGANVICLQRALKAAGYLDAPVTGKYTQATVNAVRKLQTEKELFVDGIAGRETALELGIWPDEKSTVVRTPKPPKGAKDLLGYELSSVASAGADAPPVPEDSGSGRRIVYSRMGQRVWAIDADGRTVRSWLVSGAKFANETPGTHRVYSKSKITTAWNGKATLRLMVRWLKTKIGAIGFHQIPIHRNNNKPYQTEDELGKRLSGGCQRQAPLDAKFMWDFADIGTKVVVL